MTTKEEVSRHASESSCWIIIRGHAYDVTEFLGHHPGGPKVIMNLGGQDATNAFEAIHSVDLLEKHLKESQRIGPVKDHELPSQNTSKKTEEQLRVRRRLLNKIISIPDFEPAAAQVLEPKAFAFFKAGADSENTANWNQKSWSMVRFRPRVLIPMSRVDISTNILNVSFSAPFFIAPAGGGKLANREGEILWTKAAAQHGILQWVCNNAGCSQREMTAARCHDQSLFWQIYAMKDLDITKKEIELAVASGYKGFALTVDAIQVGKRERDMRLHIPDSEADGEEVQQSTSISVTRPACYDQFDFVSAVKWLRSITDLPIAIKGIQSWEDAALCMHHGVHPWLSNHGGRQLEGAPAAIETLVEMRQHCPEVFERCDVIVDGGVTRGTDIVKALALGAKGVALGRAFLFALAFGEAGVSKAIGILKTEVETAMGLLGVSSVDELRPSHIDASSLAYAGIFRAQL